MFYTKAHKRAWQLDTAIQAEPSGAEALAGQLSRVSGGLAILHHKDSEAHREPYHSMSLPITNDGEVRGSSLQATEDLAQNQEGSTPCPS